MPSLSIHVEHVEAPGGEPVSVAHLAGKLDARTIAEFNQAMDNLVESGAANVILEMAETTYINSTGLATLLRYNDTLGARGGGMVYACVPPKVLLVMRMLGFTTLFTICDSVAAGLASISGATQASAPDVPAETASEPAAPSAPAPSQEPEPQPADEPFPPLPEATLVEPVVAEPVPAEPAPAEPQVEVSLEQPSSDADVFPTVAADEPGPAQVEQPVDEITFFDCSVTYGVASQENRLRHVSSATELADELSRAGVAKALVRRHEQSFGGPQLGNRLVAEDVAGYENLWGVWSILPTHTAEIPGPNQMLEEMARHRIVAWQFSPDLHNFAFHHRALRAWFKLAVAARVPLLIRIGDGITWTGLLDVLDRFPEMRVIVTPPSVWPPDRYVRPLLSEFPRTYLDLSNYWTDGGLEDLVSFCGPDRLLFGSGFDERYFGGIMLMLKTAQIPEDAKRNIASGTLEGLIADVHNA